jgi:hypothetical protein
LRVFESIWGNFKSIWECIFVASKLMRVDNIVFECLDNSLKMSIFLFMIPWKQRKFMKKKWTNEQMNKWTNEQMNKWANEKMKKRRKIKRLYAQLFESDFIEICELI